MKLAEIYSEPTPSSHGYVWRWRTRDGVSSQCFNFYYDCLQDARQKGYEVELEHAHGETAPDRSAGNSMK